MVNMMPKAKGERSEGMVLAALLRAGKIVLQPFGDNQRYDLVIDDNGTFIRVQCKTGRLVGGAVAFPTCSLTYSEGRRGYKGEADLFGVYCPELDKVYMVPVGETPATEARLRMQDAKNGQHLKTRLAENYELK